MAWSRLLGAVFGIACGLGFAIGVTTLITGADGAFGHGLDVPIGLLGLAGVAVTCFDMARTDRRLSQRATPPLLIGGVPGILGLLLASISMVFALFYGLLSLVPEVNGALRFSFVMLAIYHLAIALWLKHESAP